MKIFWFLNFSKAFDFVSHQMRSVAGSKHVMVAVLTLILYNAW
jgi:hypothetical protein